MKLEKYTCLGGRIDGKEIVGIKLNKQTIYPPFESDELYNSYTLGYIAHPTEGDLTTWYTVSVVKKDCFMDYELMTDWGDGTIDNKTTHQYLPMSEYTIVSNGFLDVRGTDGTAYPSKINHIRPDIIDGSYLFYDFKNADRSYANGYQFYLPETSRMTNMNRMFYNCDGLKGSLDLSSFDTSKVTNMEAMFYDCSSLTTLNLSNFDLCNVQPSPSAIFYGCINLKEIRLDNCNNDTILKMTQTIGFPVDNNGKIYCKQANAAGLTAPDGWEFVYIDAENVSYDESTEALTISDNIEQEYADEHLVINEELTVYDPDNENLMI